MTTIKDQIFKVETEIVKVEQQILSVETKLEGKLSEKDQDYYRGKKKQLREEKKQLREEKKQLREEKNLLLARPQPQPNGKLRCCSRIPFCMQFVVRIQKFLLIVILTPLLAAAIRQNNLCSNKYFLRT
jgi:hypothetical protein